jgi:hypothetical protein
VLDRVPARNIFAGNAEKRRQRLKNIKAVKTAPSLWSRQLQALRLDWLELPGEGAPTLGLLNSLNALSPFQAAFIGVDSDGPTLETCRAAHGNQGALWVNQDLFEYLQGNPPELGRVGVLNYDSFDGPCRDTTDRLRMLHHFAQRQARDYGQFLLIVNLSHATAQRPGQAETLHRAALDKVFTGPASRWPDPGECKYRSKLKWMWNVPVKYGH